MPLTSDAATEVSTASALFRAAIVNCGRDLARWEYADFLASMGSVCDAADELSQMKYRTFQPVGQKPSAVIAVNYLFQCLLDNADPEAVRAQHASDVRSATADWLSLTSLSTETRRRIFDYWRQSFFVSSTDRLFDKSVDAATSIVQRNEISSWRSFVAKLGESKVVSGKKPVFDAAKTAGDASSITPIIESISNSLAG